MRYNLLFGTAVTVTLAPLITVIILEMLCTLEGPNPGERKIGLMRKQNEVQSSLWDCCSCNTSTFSFRRHLGNAGDLMLAREWCRTME